MRRMRERKRRARENWTEEQKEAHRQRGRRWREEQGDLFSVWQGMISRCYRPEATGFKSYGGRGITVCERWRNSYEAFCEDMGPRPPGATLDRYPNKNGNYEPGNCRWATWKEQERNRRDNFIVVLDGIEVSLAEAAEATGVSRNILRSRWISAHDLSKPHPTEGRRGRRAGQSGPARRHDGGGRGRQPMTVELDGQSITLQQAADIVGISYAQAWLRWHKYRDIRKVIRRGRTPKSEDKIL